MYNSYSCTIILSEIVLVTYSRIVIFSFFLSPRPSGYNAEIMMLSESGADRERNRRRQQGLTDRYHDLETPRRLITPGQPPGSRKIELGCVNANVQLRVNFPEARPLGEEIPGVPVFSNNSVHFT